LGTEESNVAESGTTPVNTTLATWGFPQDAPDYIAEATAQMMNGFIHSTDHVANEHILLTALHTACDEVLRLRAMVTTD
jgi:hypothetical protein